MKTYVLTVSRVFPCTHKRKGDQTFFPHKVMLALGMISDVEFMEEFNALLPKIHTIRANYELWAKRIEQIQKGEAILSIRYWSEKPYNSKQVEICQLDKDSGIGVQKLIFPRPDFNFPMIDGCQSACYHPENICKNDGLSLEDFKEWFKGYDLSKPMAIIHFTSLRY